MGKLLAIVLGSIAIFVIAGAGSCFYVAYRAKTKADQIRQAYQRNDVQGLISAVSGNKVASSNTPAQPPDWKPATPDLLAAPTSHVPLQVGLAVVTAINQPFVGDYESIKSFDSVSSDSAHMQYSAQLPPGPDFGALFGQHTQNSEPQPARKIFCARTILVPDLERSQDYREYFCQAPEEKYPGTTAIEISRDTLNQLRNTGEADFKYGVNGLQQLIGSFKKIMDSSHQSDSNPSQAAPQVLAALGEEPEKSCRLRRVEAADLAFPVLVNNESVNLPALHAACRPSENDPEANFYFLDDDQNPLALAWQLGAGSDRLQAIKITWRAQQQKPAQELEQQLKTNGRVKVYGIYFDFDSDQLRPESSAVLNEIAQVLINNPDWKLNVEGHTDNIGGDQFNMDLSLRRAQAVKQALVERYDIAPDRLSTEGFGATVPVTSNDTMEGRARNRRVELVRR